MPTPPMTSTTPITGSAPHTHTPKRRVQPRSGLSLPGGSSAGLRVLHPGETLPPGLGFALPRTPLHGSPSPIARMTSLELSQGAQDPWTPLPPVPEQEVLHRRLGVMKTSSPGLGASSQVPPPTGPLVFFTVPFGTSSSDV